VANILGSSDALDAANSAVVQAQEQLKPLQSWNSGRKNMITNAQNRNANLEYANALFTQAINMSYHRDDTYYRAVNGRKQNQQRIAANNELVGTISRLSPDPLQATLQTKAREIYDVGVKMTAMTKTTSKSEVAQLKAQLTAITSTVAAAGNSATEYVTTLNNSHIQ
jgi:hypothetical protein